MAHDDALTILSESPFFIPSLVALLADLSTALWEEDPELMASPELLSQCVYHSPSLINSNDAQDGRRDRAGCAPHALRHLPFATRPR